MSGARIFASPARKIIEYQIVEGEAEMDFPILDPTGGGSVAALVKPRQKWD
jgi:hypothetical protein